MGSLLSGTWRNDPQEVEPVRKYAIIFHDEPNTQVWIVTSGSDVVTRRDGVSSKNIGELVKAISGKNYHVSLYQVTKPFLFAENSNEEEIQKILETVREK